MGSTFFSLHYHIVFSTKERRPSIRTEWRPRLHSYLGGIIRRMNGVAEIVGGVDDHVHLMASLRPVHLSC
jgi:putative transposase